MSPSPPGVRTRILLAALMVLAVFAPVTAASARSTSSVALPPVSPAPQSMRATGTDTVVSGTAAVVTGPAADAAATQTVTASLRAHRRERRDAEGPSLRSRRASTSPSTSAA